MDPRFSAPRDDLYALQMEVKQVQYTQSYHTERILRLEKRHADDAALKSVWNSPFPSVLGGTPQQGPTSTPHNEVFDDLDDHGEQLLGSLHLGPAEEELPRRGAASRANSVRFDESALQGSSWGGGNSRHSGEFGPIRPSSSLLMERSLSHKSDGRHSSAGHSVHSHHSVASGRASSLGIDTNFAADDDDAASFDIPGLPVSLFVLGSVPSIVRCWLTTNYAHDTLLYADLCTGAQKSTVDYSLIKELQLQEEIERNNDGTCRIRLNVYFAEAVITAQHGSRSNVADGSVPSVTVSFEVTGIEQSARGGEHKALRVFVGSDALTLYSADVFFSKNLVVLNGNDGERLRVPFVRPEDDAVFRNICTASMIPEKTKLNASAAPFVVAEAGKANHDKSGSVSPSHDHKDDEPDRPTSPMMETVPQASEEAENAAVGEGASRGAGEDHDTHRNGNISDNEDRSVSNAAESPPRESSTGIWGSWRQGSGGGPERPGRENGTLSGYQPATRGGRNMKVLKPHKLGSSSARTGASYEPPLPSRAVGEGRRKSQVGAGDAGVNGSNRWEARQTASSVIDGKMRLASRENRQAAENRDVSENRNASENRNGGALPRSANPVGVASAFSWMMPPAKTKTPTTATD